MVLKSFIFCMDEVESDSGGDADISLGSGKNAKQDGKQKEREQVDEVVDVIDGVKMKETRKRTESDAFHGNVLFGLKE